MLLSLVLYAYMMLVCLHFFIFGPPYRGDSFNCFTVLRCSNWCLQSLL